MDELRVLLIVAERPFVSGCWVKAAELLIVGWLLGRAEWLRLSL